MPRMLLVLIASVLVSATANGQPKQTYLPSMNYWDLSAQLLHSEPLRDNLDFSPLQVKQLHELRSELSKVVELRFNLLKKDGIPQSTTRFDCTRPWASKALLNSRSSRCSI